MNANSLLEAKDVNSAEETLATIVVKEPSGFPRVREPVCVGVPLRLEGLQNENESETHPRKFLLFDAMRRNIPASFEPLRYSSADGIFQWYLVKFLCDCRSHEELLLSVVEDTYLFSNADYHATRNTGPNERQEGKSVVAQRTGEVFEFSDDSFLSCELKVKVRGRKADLVKLVPISKDVGCKSKCDSSGISKSQTFSGKINGLQIVLNVDRWDNASLAKMELVVHNPRRAEHVNGFWDLGDPQSIFVEAIEFFFSTKNVVENKDRIIRWQRDSGESIEYTKDATWSLRQLGSGGVNWNCKNHVDRFGNVCITEPGYVEVCGLNIVKGARISPWVSIGSEEKQFAFYAPRFWETFPNGFRVEGDHVVWELLPRQSYFHEIQPGEQLAKTLWIEVLQPYRHGICRSRGLRYPLVARPLIRREQCTIPDPLTVCSNTVYPNSVENYLNSIFAKDGGFREKREVIDEYGWRNFGDVWADHEMTYADCDPPIISHYNNQYDLLFGFLNEYLRQGVDSVRDLAFDLARHVVRIDIYRTKYDRASYNNGLFWHTAHYRDALTSSHRCYSRGMITGRHRSLGGGLSNEHVYTQGLLLTYLLTGESIYRETVLGLGDRVIAMDDGKNHWLAPFSSARTGEASSTSMEGYHGPGRGCGNSVNALIDCWSLSKDEKYIKKGEELLRRMIHPSDEVENFELGNAELRWSYTVAIHAMIRWLTLVPNRNGTHEYVKTCLRNLGEWMLLNERHYLDTPESLEFPTETWAAQELRKANCMIAIAGTNCMDFISDELREKGGEHFEKAWQSLLGFDSCRLTRPSAIVLQQIPLRYRSCKYLNPKGVATPCLEIERRMLFKTQKEEVRRSARNLVGVSRMLLQALSTPSRFLPMLLESPIGRLGRHLKRSFVD